MQRKFEDKINDKLEDFSITPNNMIWKEIEAALHPDNKRRGIIWWWLPLSGVAILAGIILLWDNYSYKPSIKNTTGTFTKTINNRQLNTQYNSKSVLSAPVKRTLETKASIDRTVEINNQAKNENIKVDAQPKEMVNDKSAVLFDSSNILQNEEKLTNINSAVTNSIIDTEKLASLLRKIDTASIALKKANDSVGAIAKKTMETEPGKKKHQLFFTFGGGLLTTGNSILPATTGDENSGSVLTSSGSSYLSSATATSPNSPKKGVSLTLGATYQTQLSHRWQLQTGLLCNYLQSKQTVGTKKDSTAIGYYYQWGNTTSIHNHSYLLKVPFLFRYLLAPKQNIYLVAGGNVGWQLQYKWLVNEVQSGFHEYNKEAQNRLQANLSLGISILINKNWQLTLLDEQALTPMQQTQDNLKYWKQALLQVNYLIPSINKKSKKILK